MDLTNKKNIRYSIKRTSLNQSTSASGPSGLTLQETEAVTSILLLSPYLGQDGETALLKLTEALKSFGNFN